MKRLKSVIIFTALIYLIKSFISWDLIWFLDIPKWSNDSRFGFTFVVILILIMGATAFHDITESINKKNK